MVIFLDGKAFADAMMVVALGITISGEKRFLGFVETEYGERAGTDSVSPFIDGAGPGHLWKACS